MDKQLHYVIDLFNRIYSQKAGDYELSYGIDGKSAIQINKGMTGFFEKKEAYNIRNVTWKEWNGVQIPFLFDTKQETEILTFSEGQAIINFDIIASSFFFLSNWQEIAYKSSGDLCRFPYEESIQHKLKIIDKPVVNYYFDILKTAIEKVYGIHLSISLWKGKNFAAFISHDIDTCQTAWMQGSFRALMKGDLISILKLLGLKVFSHDAWFNFKEILASEKKEDIHSSFFFLARQGKHGKFRNGDYDIRKKKFSRVFESIRENGSETGIHGSLGTCNDLERYAEDIRRIGTAIKGNRFHFLEFDAITTPEVLEKCGIEFDSTMCFAEHYGFRNGICHPFYLWDIRNERQSKVLEIPLVLMDGTLQNTKYMNIGKEEIEPRISELVKEIRKFSGLLTVIWHNTHYSEYKYKGWDKIIGMIIRICKENDALFLNGSEIAARYGNKL